MRETATLEQHALFALAITRIERQLRELDRDTRPYMTKHQRTKLWSALKCVGDFKSKLEGKMFHDHPNLSDVWTKLYYGDGSDVGALIEAWKAEQVAKD